MSKSNASDPNNASPTKPAREEEEKRASSEPRPEIETDDPLLSPSTATHPSIKNN